MGEWATFRGGLFTFRVRRGESKEEPRLVVESLEEGCPDRVTKMLTLLANTDHEELKLKYIPNLCAAVAQILATNLEGEVLDFNRPGPISHSEQELLF